VQLVLLCNLTSINCAKQASRIAEAAALFEGDVRVVTYPYYRPRVADDAERLHRIHEAWLCAHEQGGYMPFFEENMAVVSRQIDRPAQLEQQLEVVATNAGLDASEMEACLTERRQAKALEALILGAKNAGIPTSPAILLGGRLYLGGVSSKLLLQKLIAAELVPTLGDRLVPSPD
jgi:protein-disulfide isomerase